MNNMKRLEQALYYIGKDDKKVTGFISSYLTEQYAKSARKGKFKLSDFCAKDDLRPVMNGIYHENGYQIATNAHILAVLREDYPTEWEGKIIHGKTGECIEGNYPQYNRVRPDINKYTEIVLPKLDVKELTAKYKLAKASLDYTTYHIELDGVRFGIELLLRFYPIIERIGGKAYISEPHQPLYVCNESDEWALIMPVMREDCECFLVKWE